MAFARLDNTLGIVSEDRVASSDRGDDRTLEKSVVDSRRLASDFLEIRELIEVLIDIDVSEAFSLSNSILARLCLIVAEIGRGTVR